VPEIRQTATFREWLRTLRDRAAALRIADRIQRMAHGNMGDVKPVGSGVSELRLDFGPGYRLYFTRRGPTIYLLLCGGDKSTQARDIEIAKRFAKEI
jgi:putative addiction module killer protein